MKAHRVSVNLKLGLISFAVLISVASLWYTTRLVDRLKARETSVVQLWADALAEIPKNQQQVASNPPPELLREIEGILSAVRQIPAVAASFSEEDFQDYIDVLTWARTRPRGYNIDFVTDLLADTTSSLFRNIPVIMVDSSSGMPARWYDVGDVPGNFSGLDEAESRRLTLKLMTTVEDMAAIHEPIPIVVVFPATENSPSIRFVQYVYYGESQLIVGLRWFPFVQLLFVSLFVLVGYLGFSHIRRSEQSSLWVGMAKEAAHQLGTPISSLMGWLEYLRYKEKTSPGESAEKTYEEIEEDIARLRRVASRFSDIGSLPKLDPQPIAPVIENTASYIERRLPQQGMLIKLNVDVDPDYTVPLNAELFEWVIENLLKNALDALGSDQGNITLDASSGEGIIQIDISDTGKGIDRRDWKNVFRPGFSTKKRGWGLGLSLAKRIVEDYHGGSLSLVSSRPGQGTTFRIELPESAS